MSEVRTTLVIIAFGMAFGFLAVAAIAHLATVVG